MKKKAIAYIQAWSAASGTPEKDSDRIQRDAILAYAKKNDLELVAEFKDSPVASSNMSDTRPGIFGVMERCKANGASVVLVESASRFARDLAVQLTGHALLHRENIELIPVDAPTFFTKTTPSAELVNQALGTVSEFEKAKIAGKSRSAPPASGQRAA